MVMSLAGKLLRRAQGVATLKRVTGCWFTIFPAVVFCSRAVAVVFLSPVPGKAAYGWQRDGGHAEYLLAEEKDLIHLPDALSYEDGAFISCGVGTAYEGILRGEVSGSDNVLVVGLGPVGMMAMMLAKGRGAKRVIGVDMLPDRLATAKPAGV